MAFVAQERFHQLLHLGWAPQEEQVSGLGHWHPQGMHALDRHSQSRTAVVASLAVVAKTSLVLAPVG